MNEEDLITFDVFQSGLGFIAPADFLDLLHNHCNFPQKVKSRLS